MSNTYGGDEINAIVLDAGSFHTRIGFAGDDFPKIITPSAYAERNDGQKFFGDAISYPRQDTEVKSILTDSMITDWDAAIAQYTKVFEADLKIDYEQQPILITEPIWSTTSYRKKLVESFYENFGFPALFLARSPTCVSFQSGRANCLVVDIGHNTVTATPVIDGISLTRNSLRTHYAGQYLNDRFIDVLQDKYNVSLIPKFKIASKVVTTYPDEPKYHLKPNLPNVTQSFEDFEKIKILQEMKETLLEVPEKKLISQNSNYNTTIKEQYSSNEHKRKFELPSGQTLEFGLERFQIADSIFEPQSYEFKDKQLAAKYPADNGEIDFSDTYEDYKPIKRNRKNESTQSSPSPADEVKGKGARGLSSLISQTLASVDIDLRSQVAHNVIVTGASSLVPQLTERLYLELSSMNPGLKVRLHATGNTLERYNQSWIGGSVLASLGTFHQMWVSKEEYEEAGAERILSQRFR